MEPLISAFQNHVELEEFHEVLCDFLELQGDQKEIFNTPLTKLTESWNSIAKYVFMELGNGNGERFPLLMESVMKNISVYGQMCLELEGWIVPDNMYQLILVIHDYVAADLSSNPDLLEKVVQTCESWWNKSIANKESFSVVPLLYLLKRIHGKPTRALMIRLWKLRLALHAVPYDESSPIWSYILGLFISTPFLKIPKAEKFLKFCLSNFPPLIKRAHPSVKHSLIAQNSSLAGHYANICYEAWRDSPVPETKTMIENDCIQDLLYSVLLLPNKGSKSLYSKIQQFASTIHKRGEEKESVGLFKRVYRPFIWRMLDAANADVRVNSARALFDVFPLVDQSENKQTQTDDIQKQFNAFFALMHDADHLVRSVATRGICRVLARFWSLIPSQVSDDVLKVVMCELAWDRADVEIRVNVIKGIGDMLECHECHPKLASLLPSLTDMLHDRADRVRLEFVKLLIKLKHIRTFKVWRIIEREHVFARLEIDSPSICKQLVKLVYSSFIGDDLMSNHLKYLERCVILVESGPTVCRRFYRYFTQLITLQQAVQYMMVLRKCVLACIHRCKENRRPSLCTTLQRMTQHNAGRDGTNNTTLGGFTLVEKQLTDFTIKDVEDDADSELTVENTSVMLGLLEVICILWNGIRPKLSKEANHELACITNLKMSKALNEFWNAFQEPSIRHCLVTMVTLLPDTSKSLRKESRGYFVSALNVALSDPETPGQEISGLMETLTRWEGSREVARLLEKLGKPLDTLGKGRSPNFSLSDSSLLRSFTTLLSSLLASKQSLQDLLNHRRPTLERILLRVSYITDQLHLVCENKPSDLDIFLLEILFNVYVKLHIILNHNNQEELLTLMTRLTNLHRTACSTFRDMQSGNTAATSTSDVPPSPPSKRALRALHIVADQALDDSLRPGSSEADNSTSLAEWCADLATGARSVAAFIRPITECVIMNTSSMAVAACDVFRSGACISLSHKSTVFEMLTHVDKQFRLQEPGPGSENLNKAIQEFELVFR